MENDLSVMGSEFQDHNFKGTEYQFWTLLMKTCGLKLKRKVEFQKNSYSDEDREHERRKTGGQNMKERYQICAKCEKNDKLQIKNQINNEGLDKTFKKILNKFHKT